ncbi:MAG TPA: hypothetical protein VH391_11515 [Solirubrobacterales bacterium]|jgi:hypothetical protein
MRRFVKLALLVCAVAMVFAAVSAASTKKYAVHSTITKSGHTIAGKLSSPKSKCIKNRTFTVGYRLHTPGNRTYIVTSDASGRWKVNDDLSGKGEALVDVHIGKLTISNKPHHKRVCKAGHAQKVLTF